MEDKKVYITMHKGDNDNFYVKAPFDALTKIHRIGGQWQQSGKEWKFPLDELIWINFQNEFHSELRSGLVEKDLAFVLAFEARKKRLEQFTEFKKTALKDEPTDFGVDGVSLDGKNCLFNYQRWGIKCGLTVGDGFLIGDVPGLGKSIQSLGIAIARKNRGEIRNCLIVCPASLKYNWLDEIHKFTKETALVIGHKAKNSADREKQWVAEGYFFKIVNYELVARDLYADPKKKDNRIAAWKGILNSFDMVVFDEIQYCKHHTSLRTMSCRQFNAKYRVGLSGTPIDGRLEEIHSIFQILKPGLFVSKQKFMERYAEYDYFGAVKGYHRIAEVSTKIDPYYLRRQKEEVLKDLPPKIFKDMHVQLSPANMKAYMDIVKKRSEITTEASAIELLIRARQFLDFPEILGLHNTSDKYAVFKELVDNLVKDNGQKVIVFSEYTNTLHWLIKNLEPEYDNILVIDGSVSSNERQEIVKKFNNDPNCHIILCSDAAAEGLNMQNAHAVIHYTDSYKPTKMQQRNDRAHRATTNHSVTIYRFVVDGTIDERVRDILARKMAVNNALLNEDCNEFETKGTTAMDLIKCL